MSYRRYASSLAPQIGSAPAKIAILGGGVTGLAAAHHLSRFLPSTEIIVLEAADRFGGWIKSISQITPSTHPAIDVAGELIFEAGPRTITTKDLSGWRALELVKNLNLQEQVLSVPRNSDAAKNRLIYYPDRVGLFPRSLISLALRSRQEPNVGLLSALMREPWQPARKEGPGEDESIDAFFRRRLGPVVADKLVSAIIHGIFGGDSRLLSMRATAGGMAKLEDDHGSIVRGALKSFFGKLTAPAGTLSARDMKGLQMLRKTFDRPFRKRMDKSISWSLQGGLETLIESMVQDLDTRGAQLRLSTRVKGLSPAAAGVSIETDAGNIEATHVISTIPSLRLADLLPGVASLPHLRHNPAATIGVVNLAFMHAASYHLMPMPGAGYLVPRNIAPDYNPYGALGVTFDSDLLPDQDSGYSQAPTQPTYRAPLATMYTKLSVLIGGPHWATKPKHSLPSEDLLIHQALRTLQGHFEWPRSLQPSFAHAHLQHECIPQYLVGHPRRMLELAAALRKGPWHGKLSLAGASYTGVSVRDCILSGYEVARRLAAGVPTHGLERIEEGAMGPEVEPNATEIQEGLAADASS